MVERGEVNLSEAAFRCEVDVGEEVVEVEESTTGAGEGVSFPLWFLRSLLGSGEGDDCFRRDLLEAHWWGGRRVMVAATLRIGRWEPVGWIGRESVRAVPSAGADGAQVGQK